MQRSYRHFSHSWRGVAPLRCVLLSAAQCCSALILSAAQRCLVLLSAAVLTLNFTLCQWQIPPQPGRSLYWYSVAQPFPTICSAVLCSLKQRRTEFDLQPPYGPSLTSRTLLDTCIGALSLTKALEGGMRPKVTAFWIYLGSKQVGKAAAKRNWIWWGQRYQLQGWWVHVVSVCLPTQTSSDPTTRPNVDCMQHTALVYMGDADIMIWADAAWSFQMV